MRMIVFFDLPTKTTADLREYRKFRKLLITNGFVMMQESVYTKMLLNQSVKASVLEVLKKNKPPQGLVQAITVTEKQFAGAVNIVGESVSNVIDTDEKIEKQSIDQIVDNIMKLVSDKIQSCIHFVEGKFNSIIIESPDVFREVIQDFVSEMNGIETGLVLSKDNMPIKIANNVELLMSYIPFEVNTKKLLTSLQNVLEKEAVNEENYLKTQELLTEIETYMDKLSFRLPVNLEYKISVSNLLKMAAPKLNLEQVEGIEKIFEYMQFYREVLGDRVFVFVNLRSHYNRNDVCNFVNTSVTHKYSLLLIDNKEFPLEECEERLVIDQDYCEF